MMIRSAICLALLCSLGAANGWAADKNYYKWVDENGVTHYSAHKPANRDSEQISVKTGQSVPSPNERAGEPENNGPADGSGEGSATASAANNDFKDPERCNVARENLRILQQNNRVRIRNDDGSFRYLSQAEKNEKMNEARQAIEESC